MPPQTKKVSFAQKHGARGAQAAAAAAKKPVEYGRRELPPGISNGVAILTGCELQELEDKTGYKQLDGSSAKGELVLVLTAVAKSPPTVEADGRKVKVEGIQFRKYCPLFSKGAKGDFGADWSFDDCVSAARNEMGKIAGNDFDTSDLDAAVAALAEAQPKPKFLFSTVMGKPGTKIDPKTGKPYAARVNVYWNGSEGLVDDDDDAGDAVDDQSGAGHAEGNGKPFTADVDGQNDAPEYDWDNMTLEQLGGLADSDAEAAEGSPANEAQARLSEVIEQAGHDDAWTQGHDNWAAIAAALAEEQKPKSEPKKPTMKPGGPKKVTPAPAKPVVKKPAAAPAKPGRK